MTEAQVGRLLAASLHEAILEYLPQRLDFYEHWLHSEGLRDGSIGLAPIMAVLGFLRTEGDAYDRVAARAGELATEWTIASLPTLERRAIGWLPRALRTRAALGVAKRVVRSVCSSSKASTRVRRGGASLSVKLSLFCDVREHQAMPLCGFYRAVAVSALRMFNVPASGRVEQCHARDGGSCIVALDLSRADVVADPAMAA